MFAVDTGNGLDDADRDGILRFRARGGGIMITRDHMDLGCSICNLGSIGAAHVFHTHNIDGPLPPPDDRDTTYIGWPNFHSGANGDFQPVEAELPVHPVMRDVKFLPAHPHEGAVVAPRADAPARVFANGKSLASGQRVNIAVVGKYMDLRDAYKIIYESLNHAAAS